MLAQGKTINAAAEAVGIHRNTIANWRRSSESFRNQWHTMQYEQAMYWRDEMQALAQIAVDALLKTLTDEKTSPSVRLRAALAVLNKVTEVPAKQPDLKSTQNMHNSAQPLQPIVEGDPIADEPIEDEPWGDEPGLHLPSEHQPVPPVQSAQSAQSCTTALTDLHEDLLHLDDDGIADLLEHMCMPPRMHNPAQASSPGGNRSGSSRPGSRDSS